MKKLKLGIAFFLTAVAAFVAGHYCNLPPTTGRAAGDVGRAKVYTKSVVEIDADNLQDRLQSDSVFCAATKSWATRMQSQAHNLASLIEKSNSLVGSDESFNATLDALNVPYQSVLNACSSIDLYVENLSKLSEGRRVNGFEQCYNNALLGYYLVSSKDGLADTFSNDLKDYLNNNGAENTEEIKSLLAEWTLYCLSGAVMSGNVQKAQKLSEDLSDSNLAIFFNQEQLNTIIILNQEQLNFMRNQERLNTIIILNQEQLKGARNQEQLNILRNQEQLNFVRNQEQLNIVRNQEQLNIVRNQEQLNVIKK